MNVLVAGEARTTRFLLRHFRRSGHEVSCLVPEEQGARGLAAAGARLVVVGRPSDPLALEHAGARGADALLAVSNRDEESLLACQLARRLFAVPRTLAVVNDPENDDVFRRLGIDVVLSPVALLLALLEQRAGVGDVLQLTTMADGNLTVSEVVVGRDSPVAGRPLSEVALPQTGLVACVVREGRALVPRGGTTVEVGDHLVVVALTAESAAVMRALLGPRS